MYKQHCGQSSQTVPHCTPRPPTLLNWLQARSPAGGERLQNQAASVSTQGTSTDSDLEALQATGFHCYPVKLENKS